MLQRLDSIIFDSAVALDANIAGDVKAGRSPNQIRCGYVALDSPDAHHHQQ